MARSTFSVIPTNLPARIVAANDVNSAQAEATVKNQDIDARVFESGQGLIKSPDVTGNLSFTEMLDKCVALGVEGIEMTGGGWSPGPHFRTDELLANSDLLKTK